MDPLPRAVQAANHLLDGYREANGALVTPVRLLGKNGLLHVLQRQRGVAVEVQVLPWRAERLNAWVLRYGEPGSVERAEIYLSASLDAGWARFAVAKELSHLLLDGADSFADNPVHTVRALIDSPLFARNGAGDPEYMYHVAALELLVPWRRRALLSGYRWGLLFANARRAAHFGVPAELMALRAGRGYRRMLARAHAAL